VVYRATDAAFGREVAVKVLLDKYSPDAGTARRFHDEARITGQLQHPGVPPVFDLGTLPPDGRPFLAMKLIKGDTLEALLKNRPDPAADRGRFVAVFEQVCQAVGYAHAHGVIHRDLKPANVMVGSFGEVQVMDWGLAKVLTSRDREGAGNQDPDPDSATPSTAVRSLRDSDDLLTQAGSILGTPAFMAPEQAIGAIHEIDARTDVFGLGGILATVLTGRPPFVGDTAETTRVQAARGEVAECFGRLDACGADPEMVALAKRCLAPKREDRPDDAAAVAQAVHALRVAADDRARRAEVDAAAARVQAAEQRKRRRVQLGMASAIAVLLAVGGGVAAWLAVRATGAEADARREAVRSAEARARTRAALDEVSSEAIESLLAQQRTLTDRHKAFLRRTLELYAELAADSGQDPETRAGVARASGRMMNIRMRLGELPEARAAGERAVDGLAALSGEFTNEPTYRADLANAVGGLALVLYRQGDRAGAERRYQQAVDLLDALHAADPADAKHKGDLAHFLISLANCLADRFEQKEAEASYRRAIGLLESLPAPTRETRNRLANGRYNLGLLLDETGRTGDAEAEYGRSITDYERLVKDFPGEPDLARQMSSSMINLSDLMARRKAWDEAEAMHRRGLEIQEQLARDYPAVPEYRKYLGRTLATLADLCADRGKTDEARGLFRRTVEVREQLVKQSPHTPDYRRDLGSIHNNFAWFEDERGNDAAAEAGYRKALEVQEPLIRDHPGIPEYRMEISNSYGNLGNLLWKRKDYAGAERAFRQALEQNGWLTQKYPAVPNYQMRVGADEGNIAGVYADRRENTEAVKWFTASLDHLKAARGRMTPPTREVLESSRDTAARFADTLTALGKEDADRRRQAAAVRFEKARALALLAKLGAVPHSGVTADEAKAFADQTVEALAEAVTAGWAESPAELKEPDFDAVRDRAEFKKLQAEVEEKAKTPRKG
jgi:tetratricopeptide (TPR) repeat protein